MLNYPITNLEFGSFWAKTNSKANIYLQCMGLCRGKERRAKLLTNMLWLMDNPYYWLMVILKRKQFRSQVMILLAGYRESRYPVRMIYHYSLRKY
jgi:hypothetical protein